MAEPTPPPVVSRTARRMVIVAAVVLVGLGVWWWVTQRPEEPTPPAREEEAEVDTTAREELAEQREGKVVSGAELPQALAAQARGVRALEDRVAARLAADQPRTAPLEEPIAFRVYDISWEDPGADERPLFRAPAILGRIEPIILEGDVVLPELTLREPELFLDRAPGAEQWNIERVLAGVFEEEAAPAPPGEPSTVVLSDVTIEDGYVAVRPPDTAYIFRDLDARLERVALSVPDEEGPSLSIAELSTQLVIPAEDIQRDVAVSEAGIRFPDGVAEFDVGRLAIGETVLSEIAGAYTPEAAGLGLDATLRAERFRLADVDFLLPELPEEVPPELTASFAATIEPVAGARTALRLQELEVEVDQARAAGLVAVTVGGPAGVALDTVDLTLESIPVALLERFTGPLPYGGQFGGRVRGGPEILSFDIAGEFTAPEVEEAFPTRLVGQVRFGPEGFEIRELAVELEQVPLAVLRPLAPGLPLEGVVTGRVELRGPPGRVPLELDVTLTVAGGTVALTGTIDLRGAVPAYNLSGSVSDVLLQALLEPEVPPVTITAEFVVSGRGTEPRTADATLRATGTFGGWVTDAGDGFTVQAALASGVLGLDTLRVGLGPLSVSAGGTWQFVAPASGQITYTIAVASLEPFGPYLPYLADEPVAGEIRTEGRLFGTLETPAFEGTAEGEDLRYGEWFVGTAVADYAVALTAPLPRTDLLVEVRGVETPTAGAYAAATFALESTERTFEFALDAERLGGGEVEAAADGRVLEDGRRVATLQVFRVDLDAEAWTLVAPARVAWGGPMEGIEVDDLRLEQEDGAGLIALDGRVPPTAEAGLQVDIAALPVGEVLELLGREPVVAGELWAEAFVLGPPDAPVVELEFRLLDATVEELQIARIEGEARYDDLRLEAGGVAVLDTAVAGGDVQFQADLPFSFAFEPFTADLLEAGPVRGTLAADRFPLVAVSRLSPQVEDAGGYLTGRVAVTGTVADPRLDGRLQVVEGAATFPALNQRYQEITADVVLQDQRARIETLRARSDGWATVTGTVRIESLAPADAVVDLQAQFEEFRPVGVEDAEDAAVWGDLQVAGPLTAPVITGAVRVDDGTIPLPRLAGDDVLDDEFADLEAPVEPVDGEAEPPGWFDDVLLDEVVVRAGDDLWFAAEQGRIQLGGELTLMKTTEDLRILGTLAGEEGTFVLRAGPVVRRLESIDAEVRFFGTPDINPALDITARRIVYGADGTPIEILVRVQGTLNAPTVALTTPEGAEIPESELLSFLLFGRPSFALEEGTVPGEAVFVGGLAELLSLELEEALGGEAGRPVLQIRPAPGPFLGLGVPTVVFGTEIAEDVFLRVDAGLANVVGPGESVTSTWAVVLEWRIDPEWTLSLGFEPVTRARFYRGIGPIFPVTGTDQQFFIEIRRRWTY